MTKTVKITLVAFVVALVTSVVSAKAVGSFGVVGVNLPSLSGTTSLKQYTRTRTSDITPLQGYWNGGTVTNSGEELVSVSVRTKEDSKLAPTSYWLNLGHHQQNTWGLTSNNSNYLPGDYYLQLKTTSSYFFGASTSGVWYYDQQM